MPAAARLQKAMAKEHSNQLGQLQKADGSYTEGAKETLELLLSTHFPGSQTYTDCGVEDVWQMSCTSAHHKFKGLVNKIFTPSRVRWAISTFEPFKSPGGDGIFPALLQKCMDSITPLLCIIYKGSLKLSYIPKLWREAKVVFIPKGGGRSEALPKSYRPNLLPVKGHGEGTGSVP